MKTKSVSVTVLLALFLSTAVTFLNPTSAQTSDSQEQKAQTLLTILQNNKNTPTFILFSKN